MARMQPRMQGGEQRTDGLKEKIGLREPRHQGRQGWPDTRLCGAHRGRRRRRRRRHGKGKAREVPVAVQKALEEARARCSACR